MKCLLCAKQQDAHWPHSFYTVQDGVICEKCVFGERCKHDASINPLPGHMQPMIEPYVRYREALAVGRFVLEQAALLEFKQTSTT